jgi:hypothetical protein
MIEMRAQGQSLGVRPGRFTPLARNASQHVSCPLPKPLRQHLPIDTREFLTQCFIEKRQMDSTARASMQL